MSISGSLTAAACISYPSLPDAKFATDTFHAWTAHNIRTWESLYFQWKASAFQDQIWSGWKDQWRDLFGYPGIQEVWAIRRHHFGEEFREFVEREIAGKESKPLYAVAEGSHV